MNYTQMIQMMAATIYATKGCTMEQAATEASSLYAVVAKTLKQANSWDD